MKCIFTFKKIIFSSCFIVFNALNSFGQADAGTEQKLCKNETILNATNPAPLVGKWDVISGTADILNKDLFNSQVGKLGKGKNTLRWVVKNLVTGDSDTAFVDIYNNSVEANIANVPDLCTDKATLIANKPVGTETGFWTKIPASSSTNIINPNNYKTDITNLVRGTNVFEWKIKNGLCSDSVEIKVNNYSVVANAGDGREVCKDTTTLLAIPPPLGATGFWQTVSGSVSFKNINNFKTNATLASGVNVVRWVLKDNGCEDADTIHVKNNMPYPVDAGGDLKICRNTVNLKASEPFVGSGKWTALTIGTTIDNPNNHITDAHKLELGANTFIWTVKNGICEEKDEIIVYVDTANAGGDQIICNSEADLNAQPISTAAVGRWYTTGSGTVTPIDNISAHVTGLDYGVNTFTWKVDNGICSSQDVVVITNNNPSIADAGENQTVCTPDYFLNAKPVANGIGKWTCTNPAVTIVDENNYQTRVEDLNFGQNVFTWTVSNPGCPPTFDNVIITYDIANAGTNKTVCQDTTSLNAEPSIGVGKWIVSFGGSNVLEPNNPNSKVENLDYGINEFTWEVNNGSCVANSKVVITNNSPSEANAGTDVSTCNDFYNLNAVKPENGTGVWTSTNPIVKIINPNSESTKVEDLQTGINTFRWTVRNGACPDLFDEIHINYNLPTKANAGGIQNLCKDFTSLNGNIPTTGTGTWRVYEGEVTFVDENLGTTDITGLKKGKNILIWRIESSPTCFSEDSVTINNNDPTTSFAGEGKAICKDSTYLSANIPNYGTGEWTTTGTATIVEPDNPKTLVRNLQQGSNTFKWEVTNSGCESFSYVEIINNTPIKPNAGIDTILCTDEHFLNGNQPDIGIGEWRIEYGGGSFDENSIYNTRVYDLEYGINKLRWTITKEDCVLSDTVIVTSYEVEAYAGENTVSCDGTITLEGNDPTATGSGTGVGTWTTLSPSNILNPTQFNTDVEDLAFETNIFKWTIVDKWCTDSSEVIIINNTPTQAEAGIDTTICSFMYRLKGNKPTRGTGTWTVGTGYGVFDDETVFNTQVKELAYGLNILTWKIDYKGCTSEDVINITNDLPSPAIAKQELGEQVVCDNTVNLEAEIPFIGSGVWSVVPTDPSVVIESPSAFNTNANHLPSGTPPGVKTTFRWTVTHNKCVLTDSVVITALGDTSLAANAGIDETICRNHIDTLKAVKPNHGSGSWTVIAGSGVFDEPSSNTSSVTGLGYGTNILRWTTHSVYMGTDCVDTDDIIIINDSPSPANAGIDQTVCENEAKLEASPPTRGQGIWTTVGGNGEIQNKSSHNSIVTKLDLTLNTFMWTTSFNKCKSRDTVQVWNNKVTANAGVSNYSICSDTVELFANLPTGGATGSWEVAGGAGVIDETTKHNTIARNLSDGLNTFQWTLQKEKYGKICKDVSIVEYENILPTEPFAGADRHTCFDTITLSGNEITKGEGIWKTVSTSAKIISPSTMNTKIEDLIYGDNVFKWESSYKGCKREHKVVITNEGFTTNAGDDQNICGRETIMQGVVDPTPGTGNWSVYSGTGKFEFETLFDSKITNIALDTNQYIWTVHKDGCVAKDTVMIVCNEPSDVKLNKDEIICVDTFLLQTNAPTRGEGKWEVVEGFGFVVNSTANSTVVNKLGRGLKNKITWTVTYNGCSKSDDIFITNSRVEANAGESKIICVDTILLDANSPVVGNGEWTYVPSVDLDDINIFNTVARKIPENQPVILKWTVEQDHCKAWDTMVVKNNHFKIFAGDDDETCDSTYKFSKADSPGLGTGMWNLISGNAVFDEQTLFNTEVSELDPVNVFEWVVDKNQCTARDTINIINNAFTSNAGVGGKTCDGILSLDALVATGDKGIWRVMSGSGDFDDFQKASTTVKNLKKGLNILEWEVLRNGCYSTDTIHIYNNQPTVAQIIHDTISVCDGRADLLANKPIIGTGTWKLESGSGDIDIKTDYNTEITSLGREENIVLWTISNGVCESEDTLVILNNQVFANTVKDFSTCTDTTTIIADQPVLGTGSWTRVFGNSVIDKPTSRITKVTDLDKNTNKFRWTVTYKGCNADKTLTVTNNTPEINAGKDDIACQDTFCLDANNPGTATGTWRALNPAIDFSDEHNYQAVTSNLANGKNTLIWKVETDKCTVEDTVVISNNEFKPNAGSDKEICHNVDTLFAMGTGVWSTITGGGNIEHPSLNKTKVSNLGSGLNTFQWTVTKNGCTEVDFIDIQNDSTSIANVCDDFPVCETIANLEADPASIGDGKWKGLGGTSVIIGESNNNASVKNLNNGMNKFVWTITKGKCSSSDTLTITSNSVASEAGNNDTICQNNTFLNAGGGNGRWTLVGGSGDIKTPTLFNTEVTNIGKGENTFYWIVKKDGCESADSVKIINNTFQLSAGTTIERCVNYADLLGDDPAPGTGIWTIQDGSTGTIINSTSPNARVEGLPNGSSNVFIWTVTKGKCQVAATVTVNNNFIKANAGDDKPTCNSSVFLSAGNPKGTWTTVVGNGEVQNSLSPNSFVTKLSRGANKFKWKINEDKCADSAFVVITSNRPVIANAGFNDKSCDGTYIFKGNNPGDGEGIWLKKDNNASIEDSTFCNSYVKKLNEGKNTFVWKITKEGCSSEDEVIINNNQVTAEVSKSIIDICTESCVLPGIDPSPNTGTWIPDGTTATVAEPNNPNSAVTGLTKGSHNFKWKVEKDGCINIKNITINNNSFIVSAGKDTTICTNEITLSGTPPSDAIGLWTSEVGSTGTILKPNLYNSKVIGIEKGTDTYTWTVTKNGDDGCVAVDQINVTNSTIEADAGTGHDICGNEVYLNAGNDNGIWTRETGTGIIVQSTKKNTHVTNLSLDANKFKWTVSEDGCTDEGFVVIYNITPTQAKVVKGGESCDGTAILSGNNPLGRGDGKWTPLDGGNILHDTKTFTPVIDLDEGENKFVWTIDNKGCTSSDTVFIINNEIEAHISNNNINTCGETAMLPGIDPAPYTGVWKSTTAGVKIINSTQANSTVQNLQVGKNHFSWTVSKGGCNSSKPVIINNNSFTTNAGEDTTICVDKIRLYATPPPAGATGFWINKPGASGDIKEPTQFNSLVEKINPGENVYIWTVTNGKSKCIAKDEIVVTSKMVIADAGKGRDICEDTVRLSAGNAVGIWEVKVGDGNIEHDTQRNTLVTNLSLDVNQFKWTVKNDRCSDSAFVKFTNNAPTQAVASAISNIACTDTILLEGNNPGLRGIGTWRPVGGNAIVDESLERRTVARELDEGENRFSWTIVNNSCPSVSEIVITNNHVKAEVIKPLPVCKENTTLRAVQPSPPLPGEWKPIKGTTATVHSPNAYITNVTGLVAGINRFQWKIEKAGCKDSIEVVVTNNSFTTNAGVDTTICSGEFLLSATPPTPGTGVWSYLPDGSFANFEEETLYHTKAKDLNKGVNTLKWTVTKNDCVASATVVITNNEVTAVVGKGDRLCQDFVPALPAISPAPGTGIWSSVFGTNDFVNKLQHNTRVDNLTKGLNRFMWKVKEGNCSDSAYVEYWNDIPTPATVGKDTAICKDSYMLNGNNPSYGSGQWIYPADISIDDENKFNATVSNLKRGENEFIWKIEKEGCTSEKKVVITNNSVTAFVVPLPKVVCEDKIDLTAIMPPTPLPGHWTSLDGAVIDNPISAITFATGLRKGTNRFSWTIIKDECRDSVEVSISNNSFTVSAGTSHPVCSNDETLSGTPPHPGTGEWTRLSGSTGDFVDSTLYCTKVTDMKVGVNSFKWTVNKNDCENSDIVTITNNSITADAGTGREVCEDTLVLSAGNPNGIWDVVAGGATIDFINQRQTVARNLSPDVNKFIWKVKEGDCKDSAYVIYINNKPAQAVAGVNRTICKNNTFLEGNNPGTRGKGTWIHEEGTASFDNSLNYYTNVDKLVSDKNTFIWRIKKGECPSEDRVVITNNSITARVTAEEKRVCATTGTLPGIAPLPYKGIWISLDGATIDNETLFNSQVSGLVPGRNNFRWKVTKGTGDNKCVDSIDVVLINNSFTTSAGTSRPVCSDTAELFANPAITGEGHWIVEGGGSDAYFDNSLKANTIVRKLASGKNTFRWIVKENNCTASAAVNIYNHEVKPNAGVGTPLCEDKVQLSATDPSPNKGSWTAISTSAIIDDKLAYNSNVTKLEPGNNRFMWKVENAFCSDSAYVDYSNDKPTISNAGSNKPACADSCYLTANNPTYGTGVWKKEGISITNIEDTLAFYTKVTDLVPEQNIFTWVINNNGCISKSEVVITNNSVKAYPGRDTAVCDGFARLSAVNPNPIEGEWTTLSGGAKIETPSMFNSMATGLDLGTNRFQWRVFNGHCSDSATVVVTNNHFETFAGVDTAICTNNMQLIASPPVTGTGVWSYKSDGSYGEFDESTFFNTIVRAVPRKTNTYRWTVTENGCQAYATVEVTNNAVDALVTEGKDLCSDYVAALPATEPVRGIGTWTSIEGGGTVLNKIKYNSEATELGFGFNRFRWVVDNEGCTDTAYVDYNNNTPSESIAGKDSLTCSNDIILYGNNPTYGTGKWTTIGGADIKPGAETICNAEVTNLDRGDNLFIWTITNDVCTSSSTVRITNNFIAAVSNTPATTCIDSSQLIAIDPSVDEGTGFWEVKESTGIIENDTDFNTIVKGLNKGINRFVWKVQKEKCKDQVDVIIQNYKFKTFAGKERIVCEDTTSLRAVPPRTTEGKGVWETIAGDGYAIDSTLANSHVTGLSSGANTFIWTVYENGCQASDTVIITNNEFSVNAGSNDSICKDSIFLQAMGPGLDKGHWEVRSGGGVIEKSTSYKTYVKKLGRGKNTFEWIVKMNSCTATSKIEITNGIPSQALVSEDTTICENRVLLRGNSPLHGKGYWTQITGTGKLSSHTDENIVVTKMSESVNQFEWKISDFGCTTSDTVTIINRTVVADAGLDEPICATEYQLSANEPNVGATAYWEVIGGDAVLDNNTITDAKATGLSKGANFFVWLVENDKCTATDTMVITNDLPSIAKACDGDTACENDITLRAVSPTVGSGRWYIAAGDYDHSTDSTKTVIKYFGISSGLNQFIWRIEQGSCYSEDTVNIQNNTVYAFAGLPQDNLCDESNSTRLSANDPHDGFGSWKIMSGKANVENSTAFNTHITEIKTGKNKFRWTVKKEGCTAFSDVVISNNLPSPYAGEDTALCYDYFSLSAHTPTQGTGTWSIFAGEGNFEGNSTSNLPQIKVYDLKKGANTLIWEIDNKGCKRADTIVVTNNTVDVKAEAEPIVCKNEVEVLGNYLEDAESCKWEVVAGGGTFDNETSFSTKIVGLEEGINTVQWTITANGCTNSAITKISNNSFKVSAGNDDQICEDTTSLKGSYVEGGSGEWEIMGIGHFDHPTLHNTKVTMGKGLNTFVWKVSKNGCTASDAVQITNNSYDVEAGTNRPTCEEDFILQAEEPEFGTGHWTIMQGGGEFDNDTLCNTKVLGLQKGKNKLKWEVKTGECTASDTVVIINNSIDVNAGKDKTICENSTFLEGKVPVGGETGVWSMPIGFDEIVFESPSLYNTKVTGLNQGANTFRWTLKDDNCEASADVVITNASFTAYAGADRIIYEDWVIMDATLPDGCQGYWKRKSGTGIFENTTQKDTRVNKITAPENTYEWHVTNTETGCPSKALVKITYNAITAIAGADQPICTDTIELAAVPPTLGTGEWRCLTSDEVKIVTPKKYNTKVRNIPPGTHTFRWTVTSNGIQKHDDVRITNNTFTVSGQNQEGCAEFMPLIVEELGEDSKGKWLLKSGEGLITNSTSENTTVTQLKEGENKFFWSVTKKTCTAETEVIITYHAPPVAEFKADTFKGCSPFKIDFVNESQKMETALWSFDVDQIGSTEENPSYTYVNRHKYERTHNVQLIVTSSWGCKDTIEHEIHVYPEMHVDFNVTPREQKYPETTVSFENQSEREYEQYIWDLGDGHESIGEYISDYSYDTWGEFKIRLKAVSQFGCVDTAFNTIKILAPPPIAGYSAEAKEGCAPFSVDFSNSSLYGDDYEWTFGDGGTSSNENPTYIFDYPGKYFVKLKTIGPGGEAIAINDTIIVHDNPVVDFKVPVNEVMLPNAGVSFENYSDNAANYVWYFGDNKVSDEFAPVHFYQEPGIYHVKLRASTEYGCTDSLIVWDAVTVEPAGEIIFPNAFLPKMEGSSGGAYQIDILDNTVFHPLHRGIGEYRMQIFNRWGEQVFETNDINIGWDGYLKGKLAPQGVYIWKVVGTFKNGSAFEKVGDITLFR